jgi:hypothetical protein
MTADLSVETDVPEAAARYDDLARTPFLGVVVEANRAYLTGLLDDPAELEHSHWALSCLPGGNRLSTVSMSGMETFALFGGDTDGVETISWLMNVALSPLQDADGSTTTIQRRFPRIRFDASRRHPEAGADQVCLWGDGNDLDAVLAYLPIRRAAWHLVERLLTKRTKYARFHNQPLADAVLGRAMSMSPVVGGDYRRAEVSRGIAKPLPAYAADPDTAGRGLLVHQRLQDALADRVTAVGLRPLSPAPLDPQFDLAWYAADGALVVVEVKSLILSNETRQLRMGLGQVLDYAHALKQRVGAVRPVLYIEQVVAERWAELAEEAGVSLVWPGEEGFLRL